MIHTKDLNQPELVRKIRKEIAFMDIHNPEEQKEMVIHPSVIEQYMCYGLPLRIDSTLPPNTIDVVLKK